MEEQKNIVYTIEGCPFCMMAKKLLERMGVPYQEKVVQDPGEKERLKQKYQWRTFPMVILKGKFLGGYQDIQALADTGELEQFLKT